MTDQVIASDDRAAQLARLRQYLIPNIPVALIIGSSMIALGTYFNFRVLTLFSSLPLIMGVVYIWALRQVQRKSLEGAITTISVGLAIIPVVTTLVAPQTYGLGSIIPIWSVVVALPYISGRKLKGIIAIAGLSAVASAALSFRPPVDVDPMPVWVPAALIATIAPVLTSLIFLLLWQYSSRLNDTLDMLRKAVGALKESERSLEAKVTERTEELAIARDEALEASRYLKAVMDNLADGLLVTDTRGRITHSNPALAEMFGLSQHALHNTSSQELFPKVIVDLVAETAAHPARVFTAEVNLSDGGVGKAVATAILRDSEAAAVDPAHRLGSVVLVRDITAEKQIDQMKTDFLSTVSHELRTPLTSVLGFARIIQRRLEERIIPNVHTDDRRILRAIEQVRTNIEIILNEGERLTALINDVLDLAKIEAGRIEWEMRSISIADVVDRALAATSALFEAKGIELIRDVEAGLPELIGDENRLIQVIINLLSNAVKFTEAGTVTCRVRRDRGQLLVSVIDTGIGIAQADLTKVFEKFKQVGDTLTDKPQGTGLGLPICKEIVEHHGGRIWVESEPGKGSNFSFALPILTSDPDGRQPLDLDTMLRTLTRHVVQHTPTSREDRKSILVVDDDPSIRELLDQELTAAGYIVRQADDGRDALAKIKSELPDLVLLDVMMPEISGFDLAAVLKNDPRTMGVPIIILSIVEDKERGYRLGVDRYITKPFDTETLLNEIRGVLAHGPSSKKVLIVDEDASTVRTLANALQAHGYSVVEASNDRELLERAVTLRPDMIIVNEVFSGHQDVMQALRFEKGLENVVILLYRASSETDEASA